MHSQRPTAQKERYKRYLLVLKLRNLIKTQKRYSNSSGHVGYIIPAFFLTGEAHSIISLGVGRLRCLSFGLGNAKA